MRVLISGSSGLIGTALVSALKARGNEVLRLVRSQGEMTGAIYWNPEAGMLRLEGLGEIDAVINLSGESIGAGRWTPERKRRILESRVKSTSLLASALTNLEPPPQVFISGSAMGYYGDRGADILSEENRAGRGFLAETCTAWEAATEPARKKGVRTVCLRTGMVLAPKGGALAKMLPLFRWGLGGKFGHGRQYQSWIAIDDAVGGILHIMYNEGLKGPVNLVAPGAVTNAEFTRTLAATLHRPAFFSVPVWALKIAVGEMAGPLLLDSTRAEPAKLLGSDFLFEFASLDVALKHVLM